MARKEICVEELVEVIYQWHKGIGISQIKRSLGLDRKTIRKYIELAETHGFIRDMQPQPYEYCLELASGIQRGLKTPIESSPSYKKTAVHQCTIEKLLSMPYMKPKQAYRILKMDYDYDLSYSTFNRYINIKNPKHPGSCIRIETKAGEEAQVDFGSAGMMYDPEEERLRKAHIFVMTLSYSRLHYVEFVFDQGQVTWVRCHINAFEFFILKTAVKPQRTQRNYAITKRYGDSPVHLLGYYSVIFILFKYQNVFSVRSVVNAFFRIMKSLSYYQAEAMKYGQHVTLLITKIMAEHAYRNIRKVQAIFRLAEKYGHAAMELTSKRCLYYEDIRMSTIKMVIQKGLYNLPFEEEIINTLRTDSAFTPFRDKSLTGFTRSPEYFAHTQEETE